MPSEQGQATTLLSIVPILPQEPDLTWEDYCAKPYLLFLAFTKYFAVEGKFLSNLPSIIIQNNVPSAPDRSKLWIKTSKPYGIGVFADGAYQMDYGASGLQQNVPFLQDPSLIDPDVQGITQMSDADVARFGIPQTTTDVSVATTRYRWFIFQPGEIAL